MDYWLPDSSQVNMQSHLRCYTKSIIPGNIILTSAQHIPDLDRPTSQLPLEQSVSVRSISQQVRSPDWYVGRSVFALHSVLATSMSNEVDGVCKHHRRVFLRRTSFDVSCNLHTRHDFSSGIGKPCQDLFLHLK